MPEPNYNYDDDNPINEFTIVSDFAPSEPSKLMITAANRKCTTV